MFGSVLLKKKGSHIIGTILYICCSWQLSITSEF